MNLSLAIKELEGYLDFGNYSPEDIKIQESAANRAYFNGEKIIVEYTKPTYIIKLLFTLLSDSKKKEASFSPTFEDLSFMVDCARNNALNEKTFRHFIRLLSLGGYDTLKIYLEDCFEVDNEPYFGYLRPRYSKETLRSIVTYADIFSIEVVPCIETLAHMATLKKWCVYREHFDIDDIFLVGDPRVETLLKNMFQTLSEIFVSKRVNIGFDEAYRLGRGRYLDLHGLHSRRSVMLDQLRLIAKLANQYGFSIEMWGDMFYQTEQDKDELPTFIKDIKIILWDYEPRDDAFIDELYSHYQSFQGKVAFAGGAWKWLGFAPNNRYSIYHLRGYVRAAKRLGVKEYTLTGWGDNGGEASIFSILPALYYLSAKQFGYDAIEENLFSKITGYSSEEYEALDLVNAVTLPMGENIKNGLSRLYTFNDLLLGIYDSCLDPNQEKTYRQVTKKLDLLAKRESPYAYLFKTIRDLSSFLEIKCGFGVRLREAYSNQDKEGCRQCYAKLSLLEERLTQFERSFFFQWHEESNGIGYEVQDIRIGGLFHRIKTVRRLLQRYLDGEIDHIDELDMKTLDFYGQVDTHYHPQDLVDCRYSMMGSANIND